MGDLSENAQRVLESRYLRRDEHGQVAESARQLFVRVARAVAAGERDSGGDAAVSHWEARFLEAISTLDFLPNSPTLMNAGTRLGQLSACFVLPVEDSISDIFDSLGLMARIQQSGGGTGFSFASLRPRGDVVRSTGGTASGPVSFMRIFDCATEHIRQGGRRRGANMGVLRVDHPDIEEFVDAKRDGVSFPNFNLSVGVTDAFMRAAQAGEPFELLDPATGQIVRRVDAAALLDRIADAAWRIGDPGLLFLDAINRANPTPGLGAIEATNPCGEVPLLPYEACNLGSIHLGRMFRTTGDRCEIDWDRLGETIRLAVRFLDDVIEVSRWPDPRIAKRVRHNRKIGLGVMGFAELLIRLGLPYDSDAAVGVAGELAACIAREACAASRELAGERGVFPNWRDSTWGAKSQPMRNATVVAIAPTGSLSIVADTSASIEPLFALAYRRSHVLDDRTLLEANPLFDRWARASGFHSKALVNHLQSKGSLHGFAGVPREVASVFRTALEIAPRDHLRVQAAFQRHVDNAVSKTVNLPESATRKEVADILQLAWSSQLKGVTVYRYGSRAQQVLDLGTQGSLLSHEHFARCDPHACRV